MNPTVTLLVGLPGSGKYDLAKKMADVDYKATIINCPKTYDDLEQYSKWNNSLIICDPMLCHYKIKKAAHLVLDKLWPDHTPNWMYFENNRKVCLHNLEYERSPEENIRLLNYLQPNYAIPTYVRQYKVWTTLDRHAWMIFRPL